MVPQLKPWPNYRSCNNVSMYRGLSGTQDRLSSAWTDSFIVRIIMKFPKEIYDPDASSIFILKIDHLPARRTKRMKDARIHFHAILCWLLRCSFLRPYRINHNYILLLVACLSCRLFCSRFSRELLQQSVDRAELAPWEEICEINWRVKTFAIILFNCFIVLPLCLFIYFYWFYLFIPDWLQHDMNIFTLYSVNLIFFIYQRE